jgi:hypothetical protein
MLTQGGIQRARLYSQEKGGCSPPLRNRSLSATVALWYTCSVAVLPFLRWISPNRAMRMRRYETLDKRQKGTKKGARAVQGSASQSFLLTLDTPFVRTYTFILPLETLIYEQVDFDLCVTSTVLA